MGFFDKFRAAVSRFMSGRYGSDQLNLTMVIGALIVTTIGSLSGVYFLTLAADVQQGSLPSGARKPGVSGKDAEGSPRGDGMGQQSEEQQEVSLLYLPEVQTASACAARRRKYHHHLQTVRHKIR